MTMPPDDTDPIADDLGAPDASHAPDGDWPSMSDDVYVCLLYTSPSPRDS